MIKMPDERLSASRRGMVKTLAGAWAKLAELERDARDYEGDGGAIFVRSCWCRWNGHGTGSACRRIHPRRRRTRLAEGRRRAGGRRDCFQDCRPQRSGQAGKSRPVGAFAAFARSSQRPRWRRGGIAHSPMCVCALAAYRYKKVRLRNWSGGFFASPMRRKRASTRSTSVTSLPIEPKRKRQSTPLRGGWKVTALAISRAM